MDRFLVVSADAHAGPPADQYREYLDAEFRPQFDAHQAELRKMADDLRAAGLSGNGSDNADFIRRWEKLTGGDGGLLGAHDSEYRDKLNDTEGIAVEVLFPDADVLGSGRVSSSPFGSGLGGGRGYDEDVAMAGARAHNRWVADFVAKSPGRRIGLAVLPMLHTIETAVQEVRDAHTLGLRGVMIPPRWYDYPAYNDPRYEPLWAVCAELDMPVHTHAAAGPVDYEMGSPGYMGIMSSEAQWWGVRPLHVLLWSGAFDRHPNLKFIPAELGSSWAVDLFYKADEKWLGENHNTAKFGDTNPFQKMVKDKPSDYLGRNIFIGASTPGQIDMDHRQGLDDAIMWGSDLPHPEGTYPFTKYWIRTRYGSLDEQQARNFLGLNAVKCYDLDVEELQPIVDEIGPTEDDIFGDSPMEAAPF